MCFVSQLTFSAKPLFDTHWITLTWMFAILSYPKLCVLLSWFCFISFFMPKTRGIFHASSFWHFQICLNISQLIYRHFHTVQRMTGLNPALLWSKPNFHQKTWLASKSLLSSFLHHVRTNFSWQTRGWGLSTSSILEFPLIVVFPLFSSGVGRQLWWL